MPISAFDLFSIGIGPSSSHTVGPMRAARAFAAELEQKDLLLKTSFIVVDLYGSLALTGHGHLTDTAIMLGLSGEKPEEVCPESVPNIITTIRFEEKLLLLGKKSIPFIEKEHLLFHKDRTLPLHPNGMRFRAFDDQKSELLTNVSYSVGGGFVVEHSKLAKDSVADDTLQPSHNPLPLPFSTAAALLEHAENNGNSIASVMMINEKVWRTEEQVHKDLLNIWQVMRDCIARGCQTEGILPGGLNVKRRARSLWLKLQGRKQNLPTDILEWVSLWALAVNEENAAAGRVVTAPTNGAAGVIPATLRYYEQMVEGSSEQGISTFLLTAAAIGILYKKGASISAAEMGCMGEVGVACSMAAAGLTAALGGTKEQIENAAEIGMEHHLGLTCDPIMGLVQIPCIERNTMGAIKAINAAMLALQGDGTHIVSLDQVIAAMVETGRNMSPLYKETSLGGLAVNVPEC